MGTIGWNRVVEKDMILAIPTARVTIRWMRRSC